MKPFLVAYYPNHDTRTQECAFTVMVTDEEKTVTALKLLALSNPRLRWAQRDGGMIISKQVKPQPPYDFLPSAL